MSHLLAQVQPEDLLKYGLIPEFVGRLPVVATLTELDEKSLIRILTEPKNALLKQYEKLLAFEKVKLKFTESAIVAVASKAFKQKTGARGLRSILEEVMLDLMYEIPSQREIRECVITEDVIEGRAAAAEKGQPFRPSWAWAPLARISPHLQRAVIVAEDASFYEHHGFDWEGLQEALTHNWEQGKMQRGGSTITQQLAKNLYLSS